MGEWMASLFDAALEGVSEEELYERAVDFGVDATLYRMAERCAVDVRGDVRWRAQWRWHVAETMARRRELCEVFEGLEEELGEVLVLKGEPLAVRLYKDGYARRSGDLDVMCSPGQVQRAWEVLREWGCEPLHDERPQPSLYNQWACVRPGTGRVIELHWKLCAPEIDAPEFSELYARSVEVELGEQGSVRALGDGDQLLHAAYHFHHHMGFLKGLVDVAAWWDRHGGDEALVEGVMEVARAHGVAQLVVWPLAAIGLLRGEEIGVCRAHEGLGRFYGAWTAWGVRGAFARGGGADRGLLGFKTRGVTQGEVVAWRLVGLMLVRKGFTRFLGLVWSAHGSVLNEQEEGREGWRDHVRRGRLVGKRMARGVEEIVTTRR